MLNFFHFAAVLLAIAVASPVAPIATAPAAASIADVAWMAGTWVSTNGRQTVEEHWTSPAGGAMLSVSRTVADGKLAEFEFLRIVERGGGLVYIAQPNGRPPTEFAMTRRDDDSVTFENPQHDFPQLIRYEKRTDGTLVASISGGPAGRQMSWVFRRSGVPR
ncbi:MAG TPA: DUF6265 family protein [Vicinamibacterales bacterium]|nr:DUF6265 family protein [Vicinamibacterales bacterium]